MRIGLLVESLSGDLGWGRYAAELVSRLPPDLEPIVVPTNALPLRRVPGRGREPMLTLDHAAVLAQRAWRLRRRLAACDVVHALTERLAPLAACVAGRRPFVMNAYGTFATRPLGRRGRRLVAAAVYRRAARIICISHYTEGRLRALLPEARTCVVRSGVDVDRFTGADARPADRPVILTIGAIKPRKGHHVLLEAVAKIRASVPGLEWHIVGASDFPDYEAALRRRVDELDLGGVVSFLGRLDEAALVGELRRCAVFALPAINTGDAYEGYPLVFAEAGACGRPVIGTAGNGSEEAVIDGANGLLVPQGDVDATAEALRRILTEPELAERLGADGLTRAQAQTWQRTAAAVADVYRDVGADARAIPA